MVGIEVGAKRVELKKKAGGGWQGVGGVLVIRVGF